MKNSVIFLDIDGPMIPGKARYLPNQTRLMSMFDPCASGMLNKLLVESEAKIVISSTWQSLGLEACAELLEKNGIDGSQIHSDWKTIRKMSSQRTQEILWWLDDHPEVTNYVALDDEILDAKVLPSFVQCDTMEGFSYRNFLECKHFLGIQTESDTDELLFLRRREIWRCQRHGDQFEYRTWEFADELFPVLSDHTAPHWKREYI